MKGCLCIEPWLHTFCVSAQLNSSQTKNLLEVLHRPTLKYILKFYWCKKKKWPFSYEKKVNIEISTWSRNHLFLLLFNLCWQPYFVKSLRKIIVRLQSSHNLISTKDANGCSQVLAVSWNRAHGWRMNIDSSLHMRTLDIKNERKYNLFHILF